MPGVAVAGCYSFSGEEALADGEMQRCDTVATGGIQRSVGRRVGRGSVGGAVPSVAIASGDGLGACIAEVHGEV